MSEGQKIIKYLAIAVAIVLIVNILSAIVFGLSTLAIVLKLKKADTNEDIGNLKEISENLSAYDISKLMIDTNFSKLTIKKSDSFKVESNRSDITCGIDNNRLVVKEKNNKSVKLFTGEIKSEIIVYLPEDLVLDDTKITTGAGEVYIEKLETKMLDFELGAGTIVVNELNVSVKAKINGGAGKVEIKSGEINNLDLDAGVGKFEMKAKLIGNADIDAGVGKLDIELLDGIENYTIKANKGIGSLKIYGKEIKDGETYGKGPTYIKLEGGVGAVVIK